MVGLTTGLMLCLGCASPGPPLAPSLRLPEKATKLEAVRVGGEVRLSFTVALDTTDGERNRAGMQASVCRVEAGTACLEVARVAVVPGAVTYVDRLPAALQGGTPAPLGYAVQVMNVRGRSAGVGGTVYAAGGAAPPAVSGLAVAARRGAVLIRWQPERTAAAMEVTRRGENAPAKPERKPGKGAGGDWGDRG